MRIAVVGPRYPDSFSDNICDVLETDGHEVDAVGAATPRSQNVFVNEAFSISRRLPSIERRMENRVVSRCREWSPDLVLTVESLLPDTVAEVKRLGCKVAFWFPDHVGSIGRHEMFVAPYDALFFKQPRLVERARALLGAPVHYLPEACNPRWHKPIGTERNGYVVVAGNMYPWRARLLERLLEADIPIKIFGSYWPRWLKSPEVRKHHTWRYITGDEKAREFRAAGLVLNSLYPAEVDGYNARVFEATGCGAAVLTEARPELEEWFVSGQEVQTYSTFDELLERARWLLDHPDEGREMGDAAAKRAHAEHTYSHRFRVMFEVLS
jgi:spore maturation protein CgeB